MPPCVPGRAQQAHEPPKHRCGTRDEWRNEAWRNEGWRDMRQEAASGGDCGSAQAYAVNLDANIPEVVERLKRQQYRATHVRRTDIPTGNGPRRP